MGTKLLRERTIEGENSRGPERSGKRPPVRTVTVNVANLRSGGFSPAASSASVSSTLANGYARTGKRPS